MTRQVKKPAARASKDTSLRRVTKEDGKLADYSSLKANTGIVIPEVKRVLLDRQKAEATSTIRRGLYPSEMSLADWCPRATYYRMSGLPDKETHYSLQMSNIFAQGDAIHSKWQSWLSEIGKLWGDWKCSRCAEQMKNSLKPDDLFPGSCVGSGYVDLTVYKDNGFPLHYKHDWKYKEVTLKSTSLPLSGHADGGLTEHNCLVEIKSISAGSFRFSAPKLYESHVHTIEGRKVADTDSMWRDFHSPLSSHLKQGNLYLYMAKEMNLPFNRISFLYELKSNNQVKEFIVPYSFPIIEPLIETAYKIKYALEEGYPIPDCPKGGCKNCAAYEKKD
jgi:CRISPR/Cas system-associated exonuclease Cas4 (RecB family)